MTTKCIFLDRDGVINKDINYLYKIDDFVFIDGIFDICHYFKELGYKIIVITNQSGIYRNLYTESDYQKLSKWMVNQFKLNQIDILDIYHCPHGPKSKCSCRKPKAGMLIEAKQQHKIDMKKSWMVGDKERDIEAALSAGIRNTILLSNSSKSRAKYIVDSLSKINQVIDS
jgi:D-glycero-D-manno-heptose 1,7-bisphosphate phosphatase